MKIIEHGNCYKILVENKEKILRDYWGKEITFCDSIIVYNLSEVSNKNVLAIENKFYVKYEKDDKENLVIFDTEDEYLNFMNNNQKNKKTLILKK